MRLNFAVLLPILLALFASTSMLHAQRPRQATVRRELRIDGIEADFSRIVHLAVDRHGRIIVAQPDDGYLRVFDASGTETGRIGRRGSGPGEFQGIGINRGWVSDTFWQTDVLPRRTTFWRMPDSLLRGIVLGTNGGRDADGLLGIGRLLIPGVAGVLPDGTLLVTGPFLRANGDRGWAATIPDTAAYLLLHADRTGNVRRVVAKWPPLGYGCAQVVNGRWRPTPECDSWFMSIAPDSRRIAYAEIILSRRLPQQLRVVVTQPPGDDTLFIRRLRLSPVEFTRDDADTMRARRLRTVTDPELRRDIEDIEMPRAFRPLTRLIAGREGTTWLRLRTSREGHRYLVLNPDGSTLGWASLPDDFRLEVAERAQVWGTEADADGIESVVRYRIGW